MGTCFIVPVSILLALLTSASNATAAVLQRRAAAQARSSRSLRLSLIVELARRKVWLAGIAMVVVAALCQAGALATGAIALVQPIFIIELPITLVLGSYVMHRAIPARIWISVVAVTFALGAGLAAAQPGGGSTHAFAGTWAIALIATGAFEFVVISAALRLSRRAPRRAARSRRRVRVRADRRADEERDGRAQPAAPERSSPPGSCTPRPRPGWARCSCCRTRCRPGTLVASQPMLTVGDALISISYGVVLYGEQVRVGWWLLPEIVALIVIVVGCVEIAKSPLAAAGPAQAGDGLSADGAGPVEPRTTRSGSKSSSSG